MVLLTRIYTRGGDKGKTSLGDGSRVLKCSLRIEAIGAVDEANATLGLVSLAFKGEAQPCKNLIASIQNDMFDVGADLCYPVEPDPTKGPALQVTAEQVTKLEQEIDAMNTELAPLRSFILPGGTEVSAYCHLTRTIVRRAERAVVALSADSYVNTCVIQYLNRLSDLLFVMARFYNDKGVGDILWKPGGHA